MVSLIESQAWLFAQKGWKAIPDHETPDWAALDKMLCEEYHWTPQQIDEMTIPEIRVALGNKPFPTDADRNDHVALRKRLSPEEQLFCMQLTR